MVGIPRISTDPMTVEEFFAFTDSRPDNEKWELIDGEPSLQASASRPHHRILVNLVHWLHGEALQRSAPWEVLPGIGVRVSATSLPEPDVMIRPGIAPVGDQRECDDMIVAFEILSPSTADQDLRWKRKAYTSLPSLTHYVVIAQDAVDVLVFTRDNGFAEQRFRRLDEAVEFPALGLRLSLSETYRDTGLR